MTFLLTCSVCKNKYEAKAKHSRYCSKACWRKLNQPRAELRTFICVYCGKEATSRQQRGRRFCSNNCSVLYRYHTGVFKPKPSSPEVLKKWREANPDYNKKWKAKHPEYAPKKKTAHVCKRCGIGFYGFQNEKYCSYQCRRVDESRRRYHKKKNLPFTLTGADWVFALEYFENKCAYCGDKPAKNHKDHFTPVVLGGGMTPDNIVPACPTCNSRKGGKHPAEWLADKPEVYERVRRYLDGR